MSRSTAWGTALLVVGIAIGAGGAQAVQLLTPTSFLNSGLFTLGQGETALFNVSLDDSPRTAPAAQVLMQIIDPAGTTVARQLVTLAPGQSSTLKYDVPGVYRTHAEIASAGTTFSNRRRLISTVEIVGNLSGGSCAPRMFVCSSDDGAGNGRLPD